MHRQPRSRSAIRQRLPEVDYTLVTIAGDPAKTRNLGTIYVRLKPIEERSARSVRGDGRRPQARSCRRSPANLRTSVQPVADDRRRRQPERRHPVRRSTAPT